MLNIINAWGDSECGPDYAPDTDSHTPCSLYFKFKFTPPPIRHFVTRQYVSGGVLIDFFLIAQINSSVSLPATTIKTTSHLNITQIAFLLFNDI